MDLAPNSSSISGDSGVSEVDLNNNVDMCRILNDLIGNMEKLIYDCTDYCNQIQSIREGLGEAEKQSTNYQLEEDSHGYVKVFIHGVYSIENKYVRAGMGIYWGEGSSLNISKPVSGSMNNNSSTIRAAITAIQQALQVGVKKLAIFTDSIFLTNAAVSRMEGWKKQGWKMPSGEPVKNDKDFMELDTIQSKMDIFWHYQRVSPQNKMAIQLAQAGAAMNTEEV